eukprot:sb/3463447/
MEVSKSTTGASPGKTPKTVSLNPGDTTAKGANPRRRANTATGDNPNRRANTAKGTNPVRRVNAVEGEGPTNRASPARDENRATASNSDTGKIPLTNTNPSLRETRKRRRIRDTGTKDGENTTKKVNDPSMFLTKITQHNLHTEIGATKAAMRELNHHTILALQEPYTGNANCKSTNFVPQSGICFESNSEKPKACIVMHREMAKTAYILGALTNEEIVSVRYRFGQNKTIVITSAYLSSPKGKGKINPDTEEKLVKTSKYVAEKDCAWIICTDSNGRNKSWGDRITNERGRIMECFIEEELLNIENNTYKPTFESAAGQSLIDLTLTNQKGNSLVMEWDQKQTTLSDHHQISIKLNLGNITTEERRLEKNTDKDRYKKILEEEFNKIKMEVPINPDQKYIDRKYAEIHKALKHAFERSTPITKCVHKKTTPWSPLATTIKQDIKHIKKNKEKTQEDRKKISELKKDLGTEIKNQETKQWREKISQIKNIKELALRFKAVGKKKNKLTKLKKGEDLTSEPQEILQQMAETHFPKKEAEDNKYRQKNKVNIPIEEQLQMKHLNKTVKRIKRQ